MKKFFNKIFLWIYLKLHSLMIILSIAMRNVEFNLLKADPNDLDEENKKITRKLHHNPLLEKFYAGQTDVRYTQDYYELLKKADKFMRDATPHQKAVTADKYGMSLGRKDQYGRRHDHIGFFTDGHKHSGKTIGEVLELEMKERRTTDDDLELLFIFNNKPIIVGLSKIDAVVDDEFNVKDLGRKSQTLEFPLKIVRKKDQVNKIEQLTEFLHVKKIGMGHMQLEFFIPKKFKLSEHDEKSKLFKNLIKFKQVYIRNDYDELIGFNVKNYVKRVDVIQKYKNDEGQVIEGGYDVLKFHTIEMETVSLNY